MEGATTDLHAAEARYHERCLKEFTNPKSIDDAQKDNPVKSSEEFAIRFVIRTCRNEPDNVWTSVQLHQMYLEKGGSEKNSTRFLSNLKAEMKDDICVFSCPGKVSKLILKEKASRNFNLTSFENNEEDDPNFGPVAKRTKKE